MFISLFSSSVTELVFAYSNSTCVFQDNHLQETLGYALRIGSDILYCNGFLMWLYMLVEFLAAQSPLQIKGVILCLTLASIGLYTFIGFVFERLLQTFVLRHLPNCMFYNYIIHSAIMVVIFWLFVVVSIWYKLRKRDDIVPIHRFVDEYYTRNSQ